MEIGVPSKCECMDEYEYTSKGTTLYTQLLVAPHFNLLCAGSLPLTPLPSSSLLSPLLPFSLFLCPFFSTMYLLELTNKVVSFAKFYVKPQN